MKHIASPLTQSAVRRRLAAAAAVLCCLWMFSGPEASRSEPPPPDIRIKDLKPVTPQPPAEALQPGLSVFYIFDFFRDIDEMPAMEAGRRRGKPGQPIPNLNHQFDKGPVFDSGKNRGVGVYLEGFIRFSQPGSYRFTARSNDGIRIFINDRMLINDPDVHGDRLSNRGIVEIKEPGWYGLRMQYFQRKGSAMLKLYWEIPGANARAIVPAEVLAHQ